MKTYKLKYLDEELFRYRRIDHDIKLRELELQTSKGGDGNGGRQIGKVSRPTETLVIKMSEDVVLKNLINYRDTVELLLDNLSAEQLLIFNMRWLELGNTWDDIGHKLFNSTSTIYRKREAILKKYNELLTNK